MAIKEAGDGSLPTELQPAQELLDILFDIQAGKYYEDYARSEKAIERGMTEFPDSRQLNIEKQVYELVNLDENVTDHRLIKALGDKQWKLGNKSEAMKYYDRIYNETTDGLMRLDIERKKQGEL